MQSPHRGTSAPNAIAIAAGSITAPAFGAGFGGIAEGPTAIVVGTDPQARGFACDDRFGGGGRYTGKDPSPVGTNGLQLGARAILVVD